MKNDALRLTGKIFFLTIILLASISQVISAQGKMTPEERMLSFYEEVGSLLADNQEDPDKAVRLLRTFINEHIDEYASLVHVFFNTATNAQKKRFVETYADRISAAFDKYFAVAGSPLEENEELLALLDKLPRWDIMELDKYFPKQ